MDKKEFLKILQQPNQLKNDQIFELEEFIQSYPYFQAAKVIYLKALKKQNSFRYNQNLKTTAIYTTDRSVLFDFITSDEFNDPITNLEEKEIIEEIELRDEMVIHNIMAKDTDEQEISEKLLLTEKTKQSDFTEVIVTQSESKDKIAISLEEQEPENKNKEQGSTFYHQQDTSLDSEIGSDITENTLEIPILKEPISEKIEEQIDINISVDELTFENSTSLNEEESSISKDNLSTEKTDVEDELNNQEITVEENLIDNAFFYGNKNLGDITINEEERYTKPKKKPKKEIHYNDNNTSIDINSSDEIYKSILNNPSILEEKEFSEAIKKTQSLNKPFIFEIAKDEIIERIDGNLYTNDEKDYGSSRKPSILFEPILEEQETTSENPLEETINIIPDLEKPVTFKKNESHSFNEWLQLSSFKPIDRSKPSPIIKDVKTDLIDEFMTKNPKIVPDKNSKYAIDIENFEKDDTDIMTETLARVYTEQHKYDSAIKAYEILSLKFPEKSSFFADQIKALKKLKRSNSKD